MKEKKLLQATEAVHTGQVRSAEGEQSEPIFLTSSFRFESAEQAAARFANEEQGNIYSRFTNPTVRLFEKRLAALESASDCIATSSGMAAIMLACFALCREGSKIVASRKLFGATINLLSNYVAKFGVQIEFVEGTSADEWKKATGSRADILLIETPSNPQLDVFDIELLADIAHKAGALLFVDNCMCTPILQQPIKLGADLVMHSATKLIDGQGRVLGGALLGNEELIRERIFPLLRCGGPAMSPFNAWVLVKGLETLPVRIKAMATTAHKLAQKLANSPLVEKVYYPHLAGHPNFEVARKQQSSGGSIVSFVLKGGHQTAFNFINSLQLFSITANFGDAKSTICHPATTTHSRLEPEQRTKIGIVEGLVRISAGLEEQVDLQTDLDRGFNAIA